MAAIYYIGRIKANYFLHKGERNGTIDHTQQESKIKAG